MQDDGCNRSAIRYWYINISFGIKKNSSPPKKCYSKFYFFKKERKNSCKIWEEILFIAEKVSMIQLPTTKYKDATSLK